MKKTKKISKMKNTKGKKRRGEGEEKERRRREEEKKNEKISKLLKKHIGLQTKNVLDELIRNNYSYAILILYFENEYKKSKKRFFRPAEIGTEVFRSSSSYHYRLLKSLSDLGLLRRIVPKRNEIIYELVNLKLLNELVPLACECLEK